MTLENPQINNPEMLKDDFEKKLAEYAPTAGSDYIGKAREVLKSQEESAKRDEAFIQHLKGIIVEGENKYNLAITAAVKFLETSSNKEEALDFVYAKLRELFGDYDRENSEIFTKKITLELLNKQG